MQNIDSLDLQPRVRPLNLKSLSHAELLLSTKRSVDIETGATTNVVRHFCEIARRDLYLKRGYSSMFLFAVKECGYDKSSAQRRVNAMELALKIPEVLEKIDSREMCLQTAADIQTYLNFEHGRRNAYSNDQMRELVQVCTGLSVREVQIELASRNPQIDFGVSKKMISKDRLRITHTISTTTEEKLERIKTLRSHVNPYMGLEEVIDYMAEVTLNHIDPIRKAERAEKRQAKRRAAEPVESVERVEPSDRVESDDRVKPGDRVEPCDRSGPELIATAQTSATADLNGSELPAQEPTGKVPTRNDVFAETSEVQLSVDFAKLDRGANDKATADTTDDTEKTPIEDSGRHTGKNLSSRYIAAQTQRAVRNGNGHQGCVFKDEVTGRRCGRIGGCREKIWQ